MTSEKPSLNTDWPDVRDTFTFSYILTCLLYQNLNGYRKYIQSLFKIRVYFSKNAKGTISSHGVVDCTGCSAPSTESKASPSSLG